MAVARVGISESDIAAEEPLSLQDPVWLYGQLQYCAKGEKAARLTEHLARPDTGGNIAKDVDCTVRD